MVNYFDPAILEGTGVLLSIILIIYLIRHDWEMYWVLLLSTLILALTNGMSINTNIVLLYNSITSHTSFYLVSMVISISLLGHLHREIGAMKQMVDNLRLLIQDPRVLIMFLPATISLFSSVPGGAIMSAPMVEETGRKMKMPAVEQAMSNMVYRHLVVLITPFNSSLVLASGITGISIAGFLGYTVPVITAVFAISAVHLFIRYPKISGKAREDNQEDINTGNALRIISVSAFPFVLAIFLGLAASVFFPLAVLAGITACFFINLPREGTSRILRERLIILLKGFNWPLAFSTLTIVIYKDFMLEAESFQQSVHYLIELGLPLIVLLVGLPFITGFITGNNAASLGISLPILIPFLGPEMLSIRYFGIIYLSSYAGYFGSPVHLCTYVTNEYFKTPLYTLIRQVNIYGVIMVSVGLLIALFY